MMTLKEQANAIIPLMQAILDENPRLRVAGDTPSNESYSLYLARFLETWSLISVNFPPLPKGEEWHNPADLTAEQFECDLGWRPLLQSEVRSHDTGEDASQYFDPCSKEWSPTRVGFKASNPIAGTLRVQLPMPEPAVEMTVADVEKLVGKKVKIVK